MIPEQYAFLIDPCTQLIQRITHVSDITLTQITEQIQPTQGFSGGEVRLYDQLFSSPFPEDVAEGKTFLDNLNPDSLTVLTGCKLEPSIQAATPGQRFQFERMGYFCVDPDSTPDSPVFNRTVTLKDTWARVQQQR